MTIALAAKSRGWTVLAALPEVERTRSMIGDLHSAGIPACPLPCIDPWLGGTPAKAPDVWSATRQTVGILRGARPDVVHVTIAWPSFGLSSLLAPALVNVPAVVVFQLVPQTLELPWPAAVYRATWARRQHWVAVSEHGRRTLASRLAVGARRIDVIHNGAAPAVTLATDPDQRMEARAALRRELGLPRESRIVLSVGRLDPQKGHADLCVAAAPLVSRNADLYVLVAGEGPEHHELARLTEELELGGRVRWLGRRQDIPRLLAASDLFAFPSHFEGLPFALVEAMAARLPVVTTAFPGAEEMVRNREHCLVVPVGDTVALRDAVGWALDHREAMDDMARSAEERAHDFSEAKMVERTLALLARTASRRGTPMPLRQSGASRRRCSRRG